MSIRLPVTAAQPLTEQALGQHMQLLAQERGDTSTEPLESENSSSLEPAAQHPRMPKEKLDHIFKYIDCQLNYTQESLPKPDIYSESRTPNSGGGVAASKSAVCSSTEEQHMLNQLATRAGGEPAEGQTQCQRRNGRRSMRRSLRIPSAKRPKEQQPDMEAPPNRHGRTSDNEGTMHLGAIMARLPSARNGSRHLGIFNKGKAVASGSAAIAHSETKVLQSASTHRIQPSSKSQPQAARSTPASARASTSLSDTVAHASLRTSASSHMKFSLSDNGMRDTAELVRREQDAGMPISSHANSAYLNSPFVPKSWPQNQEQHQQEQYQQRPWRDSLSCREPSICNGKQEDRVVHSQDPEVAQDSSLPAAGSSRLLIDSINECIKDISEQVEQRPPTDELADDFCGYMDERDEYNDSIFPIPNISFGTLSAFGSNFFGSQDMATQRNVGDITVSDFGNSLHRIGCPARNLQHSADINREDTSRDSVDTLPEYVPRAELPPPYPFSNRSQLFAPSRSCREMLRVNRSRTHIPLSSRSDCSAGRSLSRGGDVNNVLYTAAAGSGSTAAEEHSVDFKFYPRHM
ncbi:hypothetical protein GQ54DRAFT_294945, partial [Martensiomyces pterosporus]